MSDIQIKVSFKRKKFVQKNINEACNYKLNGCLDFK